jgi:hypothetical protein
LIHSLRGRSHRSKCKRTGILSPSSHSPKCPLSASRNPRAAARRINPDEFAPNTVRLACPNEVSQIVSNANGFSRPESRNCKNSTFRVPRFRRHRCANLCAKPRAYSTATVSRNCSSRNSCGHANPRQIAASAVVREIGVAPHCLKCTLDLPVHRAQRGFLINTLLRWSLFE